MNGEDNHAHRPLGIGAHVYDFTNTALSLESYRDNFAEVLPRTTRLPGMDGGFDLLGDGYAPTEVGAVQQSFALFSRDKDDMEELRDDLKALITWGKLPLFFQPRDSTLPERFCWARVNNVSLPQDIHKMTEWVQRGQISFQVDDPHWLVNRYEAPMWGEFVWGDGSKWGGAAPLQTLTGANTALAAANNAGNTLAQPRITYYVATGQTLVAPRLQRIAGAQVVDEVAYSGTLVAGDVLEIDCRSMSVLLNKQDAYAYLTYQHPSWLRLPPGDSTLRVLTSSASSAGKIAVRWYDTYI